MANPYSTAARNLMLDALAAQATLASLHTAFPPTDGNELAGGGYTRQAMTWNPAAAGAIDDSGAARVFNVAAGVTVAAAATRKADGTILTSHDVADESFTNAGTYTLTDADLDLNTP